MNFEIKNLKDRLYQSNERERQLSYKIESLMEKQSNLVVLLNSAQNEETNLKEVIMDQANQILLQKKREMELNAEISKRRLAAKKMYSSEKQVCKL